MSILFEATITEINSRKIIKVPIDTSKKLPSRGLVMIQGTINNIPFQAPLEPDGKESHWLELCDSVSKELNLPIGQIISLEIQPLKDWPEPEMPEDIMNAIHKAELINQWNAVTTKARWEWLRWIRSTNNPATRQKRIEVACSKLQKGDRRPCCFDTTRCTVPEISKSGVLYD